jgi:hypothetical protein
MIASWSFAPPTEDESGAADVHRTAQALLSEDVPIGPSATAHSRCRVRARARCDSSDPGQFRGRALLSTDANLRRSPILQAIDSASSRTRSLGCRAASLTSRLTSAGSTVHPSIIWSKIDIPHVCTPGAGSARNSPTHCRTRSSPMCDSKPTAATRRRSSSRDRKIS